jgi:hypothetical protein
MRFILILFLFVSIQASAQYKDFIISVRGDTLNRVDMNGKKQGPWVIHVDDLRGEQGYDEQGYFEDDKKDGKWVKFSLMGDKLAEENYRWGSLDGRSRYYTRRGGLMREESWRAIEPGKAYDTVDVLDPSDPSKVVDTVIVKVEGTTIKHGTWTYFDPEWGTILKTEEYFADKLKIPEDQATATTGTDDDEDDDLKPIDFSDSKKKTDKADKKSTAKPQVILDYEKKNSGKKKVRVRDGSTGQ